MLKVDPPGGSWANALNALLIFGRQLEAEDPQIDQLSAELLELWKVGLGSTHSKYMPKVPLSSLVA